VGCEDLAVFCDWVIAPVKIGRVIYILVVDILATQRTTHFNNEFGESITVA
jgi:hypothetical protein